MAARPIGVPLIWTHSQRFVWHWEKDGWSHIVIYLTSPYSSTPLWRWHSCFLGVTSKHISHGITFDFWLLPQEIVSLLDKTAPVSITTPYRRDNTDAMNAVKCINSNSTCVIHWVQYHRLPCPPEQDWFYCYATSAKILKISYYICFNSNLILFTNIFSFITGILKKKFAFKSSPGLNISKNQIDVMCKNFASICKHNYMRLMVNALLALP